ncbi:MAG: PhoU domain-containing protein, partial [Anaerovoracaceae bacterium]
EVLKQEVEVNKTEQRLRAKHMQRLYDNTCSPAFTVIYTDIIHNIEKVGDCCNNIAEAVLDDVHLKPTLVEKVEA